VWRAKSKSAATSDVSLQLENGNLTVDANSVKFATDDGIAVSPAVRGYL
jgi:hypothetical protein